MKGGFSPARVRSIPSLTVLVGIALVAGFFNNAVIAAVFGLTRAVDAFFAASMLPNLVMILCIDYLGKNFLPVLALARKESESSASAMASSVVTIATLLTVSVTGLLVVFRHVLFASLLPGFSPEDAALVSNYFVIMAPAIVLMTVNTFHEYVCQYDERFTLVTAIKLALPMSNVVAIVALGPVVGEYCLPIGYLLGHLVSFVLLARAARYKYRPRITVRPHLERRVFTNSAVVMSTGLLARSKSLVMNYLASSLGSGAISAVNFAAKLTEPLERSAFSGIRMFLFSRTASLFVERNERELAGLYRTGLRVTFLLLAPLLWWVALHSETIVRLFFGRGHFDSQMTLLVALTLMALVPSVLFHGVNQLLSNAFYAMNRVKVPAIVMPLGTLLYVAAAVPLSKMLGVQGLAIATSVSTGLIFAGLLVAFTRVLENFRLAWTAMNLLSYTALAGVALVAADALLAGLELPRLLYAGASLPLGGLFYLVALALLGDKTLLRLRDYARGIVADGAAA